MLLHICNEIFIFVEIFLHMIYVIDFKFYLSVATDTKMTSSPTRTLINIYFKHKKLNQKLKSESKHEKKTSFSKSF